MLINQCGFSIILYKRTHVQRLSLYEYDEYKSLVTAEIVFLLEHTEQ